MGFAARCENKHSQARRVRSEANSAKVVVSRIPLDAGDLLDEGQCPLCPIWCSMMLHEWTHAPVENQNESLASDREPSACLSHGMWHLCRASGTLTSDVDRFNKPASSLPFRKRNATKAGASPRHPGTHHFCPEGRGRNTCRPEQRQVGPPRT